MTDACDILFHDISMVISHGISIPTNFKVMHHLECINLVNNGINYLPIGAGFLPSTVSFTRSQSSSSSSTFPLCLGFIC